MRPASVRSLAFTLLSLLVHDGQAAQPFRTSLTLKDFREQVSASVILYNSYSLLTTTL